MMFYFALKNILFYKGRSVTTFILTFISTMLFILYVSMMDGSHRSMLQNSLKVYGGAIEIYRKGYRDIGGNEYLINDVKSITDKVASIEGVKKLSSRYETYGLLSHQEFSSAAMVVGIDPEAEAAMTQLKTALRQGEYLNRDSQNCLYAGSGVAKRLKVSIGEEVSFIGAASDNSFAADIFKLCGTFKTGSFEFDSSAVFVARSYFDTLMYADNKASYITIKAADLNDVDALNQKITDVLNDAALESLTWKTLMKTMVEAMEVDSIFGYVSLALFCIIIFFVIMIYGFINVSSRIKEFGVLRCIGVSKTHLLKLLLYEIIILSTLSIVLAAPLAGALCYYYSLNPIVIEGIAQMYQDYGIISDELPFDFNLFTIAWNVALIYMLNLLSIVYPYYYINAFEPIEASRHV